MQLPKGAQRAIDLLNHAGYAAYLVGGCVRDTVLGLTPHDFDICTAAPPEEMQRVFHAFRTIETGLKHGTLTVLMEGMSLEITTFRVDGEYQDHRHPQAVTFTRRIEDDLARRDFTINAMAYHPKEGMVDLFDGQKDCQRGVIRCVGDAETRFEEDALRILRALRFAARLGFEIEENTHRAILTKQSLLKNISPERIAQELKGLLLAEGALPILAKYREVLFTAIPGMKMADALWQRGLSNLQYTEKDETLRLAALLGPLGAADAKGVLQSLKLPNRLQEDVSQLITFAALEIAENTLQYNLMQVGDRLIFPLLSLQRALQTADTPGNEALFHARESKLKSTAQKLMADNACYTLSRLAVKGNDLSPLGIQGSAIGKTLQALLSAVCRREIPNEKQALLDMAKHIQ